MTKMKNENTKLKKENEALKADWENDRKILGNYRRMCDEIDEIVPELKEVDGGTIEGLVDYIKKMKAHNQTKTDQTKTDQTKTDQTKTDQTKNEKGNRKVVAVQYHPHWGIFKIPDGLDLEDKSVVKDWYVKYGTLSINYARPPRWCHLSDARSANSAQIIQWEYDPGDSDDYKWGAGEYDTGKIENAEEHGVQYSDDESDDDDNSD